jgi:hypothetical protein
LDLILGLKSQTKVKNFFGLSTIDSSQKKHRFCKETTSSFVFKGSAAMDRDFYLREFCKETSGLFTVEKNITFSSPSTASTFCLGMRSNGWTSWKDDDGKTLSEKFR